MTETRLNTKNTLTQAASHFPWAWGLTRAEWGSAYVSQGHKTNDCAPANAAILFNALTAGNWKKTDFSPWRLGWPFPLDIRGATHPRSLTKSLNALAAKLNLPLKAKYISHGSKEQLLREIQRGNPVTVIKVWKDAEAHYVTIIAYKKDSDTVFYMDPNHDYKPLTLIEKVQQQPWSAFQREWSWQVWWTKLLGLKNEMIVAQRHKI